MFDKIETVVFKYLDAFIAFLVAALIALTIVGVFARYVLNSPIPWGEEVSLALFCWFIFAGAGSAIRKKSVVSVDIVYNMFPLKLKKILTTATTVLCVVAYLVTVYLGWKLALQMGASRTGYLKISYTYLYASIPVGSIFAIFALICNLRDLIREKTTVKVYDEADVDIESLGFKEKKEER